MLPGKIVLSLAPGNDFCRHSEGDFIRLCDGRILFIYSRFTESFQDDARPISSRSRPAMKAKPGAIPAWSFRPPCTARRTS